MALRALAEAQLPADPGTSGPTASIPLAPNDLNRLVHELRVHEIELQIQNEELRRAQVELDAARARWFDLYDLAPVGYCTVSAQGMMVQSNLTLAALLGLPRAALDRVPFSHRIVPEDRAVWYRLFERVHASGTSDACELRMQRGTGHMWYAQLTVTLSTDGRGAEELRVAVSDVSARHDAEEAARSSRVMLEAIIDATPSHIYAVDSTHRLTLVNAAMAQDYGTTKTELLGRTIESLFAPDVATVVHALNDRILRTGQQESVEQHLVARTGGTPRVVLASIAPLRGADGAVSGLAGVATDVTDQRRAEAERANLAAQVQQMQKLESIGRLAGGVAHDFNNQLGVILGNAEMALLRLDAAGPEHEGLAEIRDAALRSGHLTRQLLAFARQQAIQPTMLDLNKTVANVLGMLRRLIGENIALIWRPAADLWPVTMDASQVEQILANLALNARDAIAGHGTITVATSNVVLDAAWCALHPDAEPGEHTRLTVTDDGCGMDGDVLAKIFEPFFTTKGVGEGTGLGLASVYGAIRQNGGAITVTSAVGRGTSFAIHLPRAGGDQASALESSVRESLPQGHETILLVEDEVAVRRLTAKVLERFGYTVHVADGPRQAMDLMREHDGSIDLLLTDVVMPGMDGPTMVAALRAQYPNLRYLFMSGYALNTADGQALMDDGEHFIAKPFTMAQVIAKVRQVLDRG